MYNIKTRLKYIGTGSLLVLFLFLSIYKLGANTLWHDEAEVALLGKQILKTGLPTVVHDGNFLPISHLGDYHSDFAPYLFRLQTWLMFYIAAFGMGIFGINAFGVRIFFVVFGIITLPIIYLLSLEITKNRGQSLWTTLLLMFSVQYIVLIRQARYYSPVMFFSLLATYTFLKYLVLLDFNKRTTKKGLAFAHCVFGFSMLGVFYTHYLSFYALMFSLISFYVYWLYINRKKLMSVAIISNVSPFLLTSGMLFILTTPWTLLFSQNFQSVTYSRPDIIANLVVIINKINRTAPAVVILTGIYLLLKAEFKQKELTKNDFGLIWIIIFSVIFIAFITALRIPPSTGPEFRYLLIVYPLLFILLSYVVYKALVVNSVIGFVLTLLLIFTNIFSYPWEAIIGGGYWPLPQRRLAVRSYFYEYAWNELRSGYVGPAGAIINLLKEESHPGDNVFISSEGVSLLFHLPGLTVDNDYTFWQRNKTQIQPENLTKYDWVIFRQVCDIACIFPESNVLTVQSVLYNNFEKRVLAVHDYVVDNREEIPYHLFSTPTFEPYVIVYKRNI